jgi:aminoethylphosphonate catabolism LysR family transcriptional regulator
MLYPQLRAFHAVATQGGFSKAAETLHVTQPAISAQIRALEQTYGVTLFARLGRTTVLTEPGERLLEITRRIFALEQEADEALRAARKLQPSLFKVGSDAPYSVSQLLAVYCQRNPGVHVSLMMGTAEEMQRELVSCRLDVAVLVRVQKDPRFLVVPYSTHRIVLIVGQQHPWATRASVPVKELHGQPIILRDSRYSLTHQVFERTLKQKGVAPNVIMKVDSRENLREAVAAGVGMGVTVETDALSDHRVRGLTLSGAALSIDDYLVCLKQRSELSAVRTFLGLARLGERMPAK